MMLNRSRLLWVMSRHGRESMTKLQTRCWATHAVTRQNDCMSTSAVKIPTTGYCQRHCPTGSCSHSLLPAKWSRWSGVAVVRRCGLKLSTLSITAECCYLRVSCTEGTALWHHYNPAPTSRHSDFHHSFAVSAPATWNNIPASIRDSGTFEHFQNCSENTRLQLCRIVSTRHGHGASDSLIRDLRRAANQRHICDWLINRLQQKFSLTKVQNKC